MRCPWCGSGPVMIRGDWWECGWCGDSGRLRQIPDPPSEPQPTEMPVSFSVVYHVDLAETWENMKSALKALASGRDGAPLPLLGKVLLYAISVGIRHRNAPPESGKLQELAQFLNETSDLYLDIPASFLVQAVQSDLLYPREAALSDETCGEFWQELISALTPEQYYGNEPGELFDLLQELSSAYAYFYDASGDGSEAEQRCRSELNDAFYLHWQKKMLFHPDGIRAKQLLTQGVFPEREDICRDILVTEFPEEVADCTPNILEARSWDDIVEDMFEREAAKGLQMWRTLLDIASPRLSSDPETAERLLPDWSVLEYPARCTAEAFLTALEDEIFAIQVFLSADVGGLQRNLLALCRDFHRSELGRHCLDLALNNPYLDGAWERRLRNALVPDKRHLKPQSPSMSVHVLSTEDIPDDRTVFHYCTVRIQGVRRPYSYLTGGLSLKVGDWVEVPFGKEAQPRCGQVGSLTDCTRLVAPWPPEQTKTVLRIISASML